MTTTRSTLARLTVTALGAAALALAGTSLTACAENRTHESAGEYLDNTVITTKVKAAFLEDAALKSMQISVKSYKDVVQLSGFVDSAQAKHHAGEVARGIPGVGSVKNDLIVK